MPGNERTHSEEIARLKALRAYVVESRRGAGETLEADVKQVTKCQRAIRAIDEAIADERKESRGKARRQSKARR